MVNETLVNIYCQCSEPAKLTIDTTKPKMVLEQLTKAQVRYTWETTRDERIDNIQSVIEVRVYLPGHILYGRYVYKTADASDAHLYAINNAVKTIMYETTVEAQKTAPASQPVPQLIPTTTPQPATQEDILNMLQETGAISTPVTTAEQLNNDPREELPFEDFALDSNELDKLLSGNAPIQQAAPTPVQPQNTINGFTQEQIQAINNFKQQMGITDDAVLCNYINAWNNKFSKKTDLNPSNIDSFIEWTKSVGKSPC